MKEKKKILFVCLGNICRSSSAEGVMRHLIEEAGREDEFDLIIGMDDRNIDDLKERAPSVEACGKIHRMTEYCTKFAHADYVPDPYYGGAEGFEYVLDILEDACAGLFGAVGE